MGSGEGGVSPQWSVFDGVKSIPSNPDSLMAEINFAISSLEYGRATYLLHPSTSTSNTSGRTISDPPPQYDARLADEAYKAGCAALAAGKLDVALQSLQISLSKCPPHKASAISKLQSLISLTSQQLGNPVGESIIGQLDTQRRGKFVMTV